MSYWFVVGSGIVGTSRIIGYEGTHQARIFAISAETRVMAIGR